jgi:hypothetical protein
MWLHRKKGSIEAPAQIEAQDLQVTFPASTGEVSCDGTNITIGQNLQAQTFNATRVTFTPDAGSSTIPYGYTIFKNGIEFISASNVTGTQQKLIGFLTMETFIQLFCIFHSRLLSRM